MTDAAVHLRLDSHLRLYQPGDELTGTFFADEAEMADVRAAELSVLWYTAGKGEEDLAVLYFERFAATEESRFDLRMRRRFSARLPNSPQSYDGVILKICWCVRLRLFHMRGAETVADVPFQLGSVRPAVLT